jgi:hypothetical protein
VSKTTTWPPQCPDLTPSDLFLWGLAKDKFTDENQENLWNYNKKLIFLMKSVESVSSRLQKCAQNAGAHVEIWH